MEKDRYTSVEYARLVIIAEILRAMRGLFSFAAAEREQTHCAIKLQMRARSVSPQIRVLLTLLTVAKPTCQ